MSKPEFGNFANLTATGETAAKDVSHLEEVAVCVGGTFVGTCGVEVSFDGSTWVPHPTLTGKTAPFSGAIGFRCKQIRMDCSAYTSGTIQSAYSGSDTDQEG